jgi:1,4-alpha-glucan branching enzyme
MKNSLWRGRILQATIAWQIFLVVGGKPIGANAQTFSTRAGWGSTPYSTGCTFRVWAPNATTVTVAGQWDGYSTTANPLFHDPVYTQGTSWVWSVDVPGVTNTLQYKYYINGNTYKQDPRGRAEVSATGNSIIYNTTNFNWAGDNFTAPGLSNAVVYELHIGTFATPGTFLAATNLFPYLQQLGINVIEVMPINEFPCCESWGYNPSDIFGVDSTYGGPDPFKAFVKAAHQYGMAALLDVEHNHYGPSDLDLWQFDGSYVSLGGTNYGGIYFYQNNCQANTPYGATRPDYGTAQVAQFITDNFTMWLNECHVDGFRWDSPGYMYIDNCGNTISAAASLIENVSAMVHTGYVGKINIGEDQNEFKGTDGFDATWDGNAFYNDIEPQLANSSDSNRNMGAISSAVTINTQSGMDSSWGNVVFLESHDLCGDLNNGERLPYDIDSSAPTSYYARKRATLGTAITLTTCGIPMLLEGEDMLTTAQFSSNNPLNWSLTNTYSGIVSLYTDLIHLRLNLSGRSPGLEGLNTSVIWEDNANKLIAYRRWNTGNVGDDVIVICNFANTNWPAYSVSGFPHTNVWYTQFNSDLTKYSPDYGNYGSISTTVGVSSTTATISIAPYSVLVLSQNIPGAPPTPQNLKVTNVTTNQIAINWGASGGATGYIVKRDGSQIVTTSATSYTDTGLMVGAMYCYTVDSTNNFGGVSADSASVCATTLPATSATNLLAYWTFDEDTGTIAYDYSGNSNTGTVTLDTINEGGWTTSGIISNALFFSGVYTEVTVPNSSSLNPVNGITVAAWVNATDFWSPNNRILEKGASENQYSLYINGSGQLAFFVAGVTNVVASLPSIGVWHHVAGTYDGSSALSLYIDGQLVAQQPASGALPVTTDSLSIGNKPGSDSPGDDFYGTIDDVRVYGSALPAAQISQLYNFDSVGDGIPNWWRLLWFGSSSSTNTSACTACCAACDADGTGQNNFFKYVAGLNPTDPTQIFVLQIAPSNQVMNLTFGPINSTNSYIVQSSPDLANYSGLACSSAQSVGSNQITVTDCAPWPSNEFYRVQISLPTR